MAWGGQRSEVRVKLELTRSLQMKNSRILQVYVLGGVTLWAQISLYHWQYMRYRERLYTSDLSPLLFRITRGSWWKRHSDGTAQATERCLWFPPRWSFPVFLHITLLCCIAKTDYIKTFCAKPCLQRYHKKEWNYVLLERSEGMWCPLNRFLAEVGS